MDLCMGCTRQLIRGGIRYVDTDFFNVNDQVSDYYKFRFRVEHTA